MHKALSYFNIDKMLSLWGEGFVPFLFLDEYSRNNLTTISKIDIFWESVIEGLHKEKFDDLANKTINKIMQVLRSFLKEEEELKRIKEFYEKYLIHQVKVKLLQDLHLYLINLFIMNDAPEKVDDDVIEEYHKLILAIAREEAHPLPKIPLHTSSMYAMRDRIIRFYNEGKGFERTFNYCTDLILVTLLLSRDEFQKAQKIIQEFEENYQAVNNELFVSNSKVKKLINEKRFIWQEYANERKDKITRLLPDCRFKNGNINYSKLAAHLEVNPKTAKAWCVRLSIK